MVSRPKTVVFGGFVALKGHVKQPYNTGKYVKTVVFSGFQVVSRWVHYIEAVDLV